MTKLISKENPWLDDESCELLDSQSVDSYEKKPNSFFLRGKDDSLSASRQERLQKHTVSQSSDVPEVTDRSEWTFPKPKFIDFLLTNEQLQQSKLSSQAEIVHLIINSLPLNEEAMIEVVKAYIRNHFRSISKPQKRFTLAAVEKVEVEVLQQEEHEKAYIERQAQMFEACKEKLVEEYEDNYVLFEDGTILDSGKTRVELAMRAYQKYGMRPLFIEKVVSEPESLAAVWTPFPLTK